jgi:hypothetical protein
LARAAGRRRSTKLAKLVRDPQGVGIGAIPSCVTSVPLTLFWGEKETPMRLVGGLMGVTQVDQTLAVEAECGWAVIYEEPVDPVSSRDQWLEARRKPRRQNQPGK